MTKRELNNFYKSNWRAVASGNYNFLAKNDNWWPTETKNCWKTTPFLYFSVFLFLLFYFSLLFPSSYDTMKYREMDEHYIEQNSSTLGSWVRRALCFGDSLVPQSHVTLASEKNMQLLPMNILHLKNKIWATWVLIALLALKQHAFPLSEE